MTKRRAKKPKQSQAQRPANVYEPTPDEQAALERIRARQKGRKAPKMKVRVEDGAACLEPKHKDRTVGWALLLDSLGTADFDFTEGLLRQLLNVGSEGSEVSERGLNFMLAAVQSIQPRDTVEAMLAAQMGAVHLATMTFARRLAHVDNINQQDSAERAFNKLARTFAAQISALKAYRSKGQQVVRVERVVVNEGGQAIVGDVSHQGGGHEKAMEQPHALEYAQRAAMPCSLKANGAALPIAGG